MGKLYLCLKLTSDKNTGMLFVIELLDIAKQNIR